MDQAAGIGSHRWQLSRAGIINVYQYENEILHFAGGRLLLRGVNGSGKSTAMNMLLPFLLTARQGRIDAAGEQRRILRSWMLEGRDDAQPVGYLWIEFERDGHFLVCGCGIKANRQSDTVNTWWFITERRPTIDVHLVEGGAALSADALRAVLDGDEVYNDNRRREYRGEVERRLFGGASLDQHLGLIDVVRSPRVGDRLDLDLSTLLVNALPDLSEQALSDAAQPLDDLDDHRRNVADLERTLGAVRGILDSYRSYCVADVHARLGAASETATRSAHLERERTRAHRRADATRRTVTEVEAEIGRLEAVERTLTIEIGALRDNPIYQQGEHLVTLRARVADLKRAAERAADRTRRSEAALVDRRTTVGKGQATVDDDLVALNAVLQAVHVEATALSLDARGPGAQAVGSAPVDGGGDLCEPVGAPMLDDARGDLGRVTSAIATRRLDVDEVVARRRATELAEHELADADRRLEQATKDRDLKREQRDSALADLTARQVQWRAATTTWLAELDDGGPMTLVETDDETTTHAALAVRADQLIEGREAEVARVEAIVEQLRHDADVALIRLDELDARSEPDPPALIWQTAADHCLADLVDFADHLDGDTRALLEAALEASGLLSARVTSDGSTWLATGELVALVAEGVDAPLSAALIVTVPERLAGDVDAGLVGKLLDSISTDVSSDAPTVVALDGTFRVGALRGRHAKTRAEHVGVTARRAALERARELAREALALARSLLGHAVAAHESAHGALVAGRALRSRLPSTTEIVAARATWEAREGDAIAAEETLDEAHDHQRHCDASAADAASELQRAANTLALPTDADGLARTLHDLGELRREVDSALSGIERLRRSIDQWRERVVDWRMAAADAEGDADAARSTVDAHTERAAELATIEDTLGVPYQELLATISHAEGELESCREALAGAQAARLTAIGERADAKAKAEGADTAADDADGQCERDRLALLAALDTPGYLDAMASDGAKPSIARDTTGTDGLTRTIASVRVSLAPASIATTADGVRMSIQQRRPSVGAGWDPEARQPDPSLPLMVEVSGPTGRAPLPAALRAIEEQHHRLAGLLNAKQDAALRELLQGMIAREVAERIHGAVELIRRMNDRLATVTTSHAIGVRLRWRRSLELDPPTTRLVELLATLPDLRTADDDDELRTLLAQRLDDARRTHPDIPYRQLIADTLDYKRWHDLTIFVRRGAREETLGRQIRLSEGEKKLVTYVPLFAAVAASYDALADRTMGPGEEPLGIARFVLLDDAFAKVSEDNHAKLFGLLVDLDLDLIATSERLWGTHATVPHLAITEVVRDAEAGVILLEHFRWDGHTLERLAAR